jgi:hypothetical protein
MFNDTLAERLDHAADAAEALERDASAVIKAYRRRAKGVANVLSTVAHHAGGVVVDRRSPVARLASANLCVALLDCLIDDAPGWYVRADLMPRLEAMRDQAEQVAALVAEARDE